jgi:hypothetical protein
MPVAVDRCHPWIDPVLEATVIEPFVEWLIATQRKYRAWARQTAMPLRQLLREMDEARLLAVRTEELHLWSEWITLTRARGKMGRRAHRLFRQYRGIE